MPKFRSPVLGFNHNIRHRGWIFHVQTEDSGVQNPHIFTHLFHGGVIISTKKMVYDAEADPDVVKSLMQAQHKSVLKELKGGAHDAKIQQYLGAFPEGGGVVEAVDEAEVTIPSPVPEMEVVMEAEPPPAPEPPPPPPPSDAGRWVSRPALKERPFEKSGRYPAVTPPGRVRKLTPVVDVPVAERPAFTPKPPGRPSAEPPPVRPAAAPPHLSPAAASRSSVSDVVVARPAVIIGGPGKVHGREAPPPPPDSIFGQDLISEKSLDEVILAYLSEDKDD